MEGELIGDTSVQLYTKAINLSTEHAILSIRMSRLFLASASPRRHELLQKAGIDFNVIPNGLDDETLDPLPVREAIRKLALKKAVASAKNYRGLILAADTLVVIGSNVLGKPESLAHAKHMLTQLSGRTHV